MTSDERKRLVELVLRSVKGEELNQEERDELAQLRKKDRQEKDED
jgi:hypothetical protein